MHADCQYTLQCTGIIKLNASGKTFGTSGFKPEVHFPEFPNIRATKKQFNAIEEHEIVRKSSKFHPLPVFDCLANPVQNSNSDTS